MPVPPRELSCPLLNRGLVWPARTLPIPHRMKDRHVTVARKCLSGSSPLLSSQAPYPNFSHVRSLQIHSLSVPIGLPVLAAVDLVRI